MERKILKASAGTGKTYRLALEYLVSLLEGEKIKDIVIMTFTKKAAGEIRNRIIDFLRELSLGEKETAENIVKLYPERFSHAEEICRRAGKIYNEVIFNKDSLKIFTIDGLKNLIFKTAIAPMLNINSYEIIDDTQNQEYLRRCFEKIFRSRKDFDILKNFLEANVERDAEKYVEVIEHIIDERWKSLVIDKKERKQYELSGILNHLDKSLEALESIFEKKSKEGETIKNFVKKEYYPYLEKNTQEEKEKFIYDNWSMIFDKDIKNGQKTRTSKKIDITAELEEIAEQHEELLKELAKRIYNDTIIPYEKEIFSFLERVYAVYDEIKFREKKFTHNDITNYTLEYIGDKRLNLIDEKGVTEYMKDILESSISTIFIDEFQDTSVVQWKIFKSIIDSAERVICVGDDKQSIYGWRGGDKKLFVNLAEMINGKEEYLDTSYRSCKNIVEFTNEFFRTYSAAAKTNEINWGFEKVKSSKTKEEGYIEMIDGRIYDDGGLEKAAEILKEKFNGNYKGIGILARNNATLNEMAQILLENRIPYFLETNLDIFSHRTTEPVINLMRYFVTGNNFYLTFFLRDDLILIDEKSLKEIFSWEKDLEEFHFTDKDAETVLEKIKKFRRDYMENSGRNINLLIEIIDEFGILKKYNKESDIQNIYDFIDAAREFDSIAELLREIDTNKKNSRYTQSSVKMENAVTLMSIHKSKGLEFDTVFYIHKENSSRADSGVQFNISMSRDYSEVDDYMIIDSRFEKVLTHLEGQYDYAEDKKNRREEEEINNIYVALTRPKNNLFIVLSKVKDSSLMKETSEKYFSEGMSIWNSGKMVFSSEENTDKNIDTEKLFREADNFKIDFSDYEYNEDEIEENILKLKEEERKFSSEREEKREIGTAVHFYLENLIHNTEEEREKAEKLTISRFGVSFGKENIKNLLNSQGVKRFLKENEFIFSEEWDMIMPEYSIYSENESRLYRLDRVMIKKPEGDRKGKLLVVDYKTGSFEESQLANYVSILNEDVKKLKDYEKYEIEGKYLKIDL